MKVNYSLRIFKPAYSKLVPEPGNRKDCSIEAIWRKNTLGYMALLILALVCVASAGQ